METILRLVAELCVYQRSSPKALVEHGRRLAALYGLVCNPVGVGNAKTGAPSTYRPVGSTCPKCPYEKECYALGGHVRIHQARASPATDPSLTAAAIAMVAAARVGSPARLHVSGDFFEGGEVDVEYVLGLCEIAGAIRAQLPSSAPLAWTYTHIPVDVFEPHRLLLSSYGIEVLYSDCFAVGGAVVFPFEHIESLRAEHRELTFAKCRAQLDASVSCIDCGLCWEARKRRLTIVFDPHGHGEADLRAALVA